MTFRNSSDCGAKSALAVREGKRGERRRRRGSFPNQYQQGEFTPTRTSGGGKKVARERRSSSGLAGLSNFAGRYTGSLQMR